MANKITQKEINQIVWKACDTFRSVIDPSQYKDYILTMLFLKYVSDVNKEKRIQYLEKYKGDEERTERAMKMERFIVPSNSSFEFLYEGRNEINLGELIDIALSDLEEANREKLSSEDGSGIFRNISFNSSNLGDTKDKNNRLKNLILDFSELNLSPSHLEKNDIIGDAYEFLISNFASDAGKKAGEFFTPSEVSTLLAKLTKSKSGAKICDPTCGSGSLLIKAGKEVGSDNFSLYGQEANGSTWALAVMNMFLHGFDSATIRWGDTIRNPKLKEGDALMKFDTVVANPPFSLDKWGKVDDKEDNKSGTNFDPETDRYNRFWRGIPPKSKGDWAFISHMIETINDTGKVGVVVPHGVLFRGSSEGKIRQKTIEENILEAVIGLPANLFFGTGIPAAILVFNKAKDKNKNVLFIDSSQQYDSAKNQNKLNENHINKIVETYRQFNEGKLKDGVIEEKYSYVATFEEISENDFNLNIPRYVDTFEEETEVNISDVQREIEKLEDELKSVQTEMNKYLKELMS
ncbi:MAG TPA: type I restriction-modification system subunit M [Bacteroidales bacterium]|nr:MAG: type I restriction-modification system subunit M [Bacteroidetes bacterium GWF2_33_38]OFY75763.1 MAG: type I restriction-modification system subunit M [Bacteroidetes bacterium RIFOXYA12_FULL_33_9]OFY91319.1 MAG: type I restriction-modification system subunit M [Bacteroidetes bacterium RIFOXYA2_FULL_33_7]HBF88602.1 type I restriction-modification system subunit M [Bacteroidales bacterium]